MALSKNDLRTMIKNLKRAISPEKIEEEAQTVFDTIEALRVFQNAKNVMLYASLPDELPTSDTIKRWSNSKDVYLPRVSGDDIEVVKLDGDMVTGSFGIQEPQGESVSPECLDLIIVPAVALDRHCNRLGRGRGFYDRLLRSSKAFTIGVAFDVQFVDEVPTEETDVPLCGIVTASHVSFRKSYAAYQAEKRKNQI